MTPIQQYLIPYVLNEKDCLGCAQTGSGKTVSFLTPVVSFELIFLLFYFFNLF